LVSPDLTTNGAPIYHPQQRDEEKLALGELHRQHSRKANYYQLQITAKGDFHEKVMDFTDYLAHSFGPLRTRLCTAE
jgi:hypothetical protein